MIYLRKLQVAAASLGLAALCGCRAGYEVVDTSDYRMEQGFRLAWAKCVNNHGDIAGLARLHDYKSDSPALVREGKLHLLDLRDAKDDLSPAVACLNDAGTMVGTILRDKRGIAAVWEIGKPRREIALAPDTVSDEAKAIGNSGIIVGISFRKDRPPAGFVLEPGREAILLAGHVAMGVNGKGQVVGTSLAAPSKPERAFIWTEGRFRDLPPLPAPAAVETSSYAAAINESGQAAGCSLVGTDSIPAMWNADGSVVRLGGDDARWRNDKGAIRGCAHAINAKGEVVGYVSTPNGDAAFIWDAAHGLRDLNDVVNPFARRWARFTDAVSINDRGEIVGSSTSFGGEAGSFLLRPR